MVTLYRNSLRDLHFPNGCSLCLRRGGWPCISTRTARKAANWRWLTPHIMLGRSPVTLKQGDSFQTGASPGLLVTQIGACARKLFGPVVNPRHTTPAEKSHSRLSSPAMEEQPRCLRYLNFPTERPAGQPILRATTSLTSRRCSYRFRHFL